MMGKKVFTWIGCITISFLVIYAILITCVEIVAYGSMSYYEKEYEKYSVEEALDMEMRDIMYVTEEMLDFLRGERDNLVVETKVAGEEREFFNEREISHMVDVQVLFLAGISGRRISIVLTLVILMVLRIIKSDWMKVISKAFKYATLVFGGVVAILGALFAYDFYKYFEIFHKIFFEGDTWLFDPNESLMINMLPEGLFYDMSIRIVIIFLISMAVCLFITRFLNLYSIELEKRKN